MAEPDTSAVDTAVASPLAWRVASMSLDFLLDVLEMGRRDRDLVDSLLIGAIAVTNLSGADRDAEHEIAVAGLERPVPDELRRQISVNAIAQSLGMPFETARRRVRSLEDAGIVVSGPQGVYVPGAVLNTQNYLTIVFARHHRLADFYRELQGIEALPPPPPPTGTSRLGPGAVRLSNRSMGEYMLRAADGIFSVAGDPTSCLILIDMLRANLDDLDDAGRLDYARRPLAVGRPERIAAIAARQSLSSETCRRHVLRLAEAGFCVRHRGGWIAVAPPGSENAIARLAADNLVSVQRLFSRLRQLGVLELWDVSAAPAQSAARS